jgi:hypothetical protein
VGVVSRCDYHVHIYEPPGSRVAIIRGAPREFLDSVQIPAMWSPTRRGFVVRMDNVADIVARLEYGNASVRFHEKDPRR